MATCFYCLGDHETSLCISKATDTIVSSQEAAAEAMSYAIESAGYQTREQLQAMESDLLSGLNDVRTSVEELHDFLSWAHSDTIWRMEKQIELLTGIHDMLKNPRATQANELYKMGIDSFRRRRLADAQKLLEEARELNPGDYRIHMTLGHVCVRMDALLESLEYFQAAVDYARGPSYKKDALLLKSRTLRCLRRIDEAIETAREAAAIEPNYAPVHYELASCLAARLKGPSAGA